MTAIGATARALIQDALDEHAGQDEFSYDTYWSHAVTDQGTGPVLHMVLIARNPLLGGPPLVAHQPLAPTRAGLSEIPTLIRDAVVAVHAEQRRLAAGAS